ncbi:MAG TPA: hypothetical protein VFD05_02795 [Bacilli bacterium]|nr:hypothetical protein [Bacilli bacterium]
MLEAAKKKYGQRKPILKVELKEVLGIKNINTFDQYLSFLVKTKLIKRYENGVYYFPEENERFKDLSLTLNDVIFKLYLSDNQGIRAGAHLLYKYKLTTQVSKYYEIITNNVSKSTRAKKKYEGKVTLNGAKFTLTAGNLKYAEFIELINNIKLSDYSKHETISKISRVFIDKALKKEKLMYYASFYKGHYYNELHKNIKEIMREIIHL